jgi:hypothetical protein
MVVVHQGWPKHPITACIFGTYVLVCHLAQQQADQGLPRKGYACPAPSRGRQIGNRLQHYNTTILPPAPQGKCKITKIGIRNGSTRGIEGGGAKGTNANEENDANECDANEEKEEISSRGGKLKSLRLHWKDCQ